MKTVLVTGAAGFVGRSLISRLARQKSYHLVAVVRSPPRGLETGITYVKADLAESGWTAQLPQADAVIHLAQSKHYRKFPEGAEDMFRVNVQSTVELLDWSRINGVQRFILASTGNVYAPSSEPHVETGECLPGSMYAATKLAAELFARQYSSFFEVLVLRIFGVYGPGQRDMLIPNMVAKVQRGEEVVLAKGTGPYLTPIFIDDCVAMISGLLETTDVGRSEIFNIAGNEGTDLRGVIEIIEHETGKKACVREVSGNPSNLAGSIDRICQVLQKTPTTSLSEGLRITIKETD